ncbi:MAG TPA: site-specific DNA-methyltransferase [Bacteroidales bacterium]|nr:site-specific DNA-methyltransferase [Bacteroidales bacterium]
MQKKQRLELTWIGKGEKDNPKLEPRILIEDSEKSYGDKNTENILIHGDNLLALKALEQDYAGKVKCIYIDPPYNTGNAFEHYDDGLEHSEWLNLIKPRLVLLRSLLSNDGSIWISIDDQECHYLKVLCDELFGRNNFITSITWGKRVSPANDAKFFSSDHDYILVYAKNKDNWVINRLERSESNNSYYKNPDSDHRGAWNSITYTGNKTRLERPNLYYGIVNPNTNITVYPPETLTWRYSEETHLINEQNNLIYWGKDGKSSIPRLKQFLSDAKRVVPRTIWTADDVGSTQTSMTEQKKMFEAPFATPKPEILLERVLTIGTKKGDLVLDSFLGSGTTAAVAHKMGRKWIGIELGEHCHTHCIPRLQKVTDGTDQGGISKAVNWQGGGGFKYYYLAPSLLKKDKFGNWVIEEQYNADMLAAAMAKQEGFRYSPDSELYWKQGFSNEFDFIYTTTQFLTVEMLDSIYSEMKSSETLLIACKSFQDGCNKRYPNINIKKIPSMLLGRCEFGKEDYSLNILSLPEVEDSAEDDE